MSEITPTPPKKKAISSLLLGDEVDSWCGKCGGFRLHKVNTLQPPKPPKSVCLTCKAVHQVRYQQPGSKKSGSNELANIPPWPELIAGVDPDQATPYTITGSFKNDELIMHKTFGLGRVVVVSNRHRAQMSFESGIKLLVQNHGL